MATDEFGEREEASGSEISQGSWGWSEGRVKKCLVRGRGWMPPHVRMRKVLATQLLVCVEQCDLEQNFSL